MDQRSCRVLILDSDPDTLIALQHLLEHAEFDTTITWDKAEACRLLKTEPFALVLIGDHPPELDAAAILEDLSLQGASCPSLICGRLSEKRKFNISVDSVRLECFQSEIPLWFSKRWHEYWLPGH